MSYYYYSIKILLTPYEASETNNRTIYESYIILNASLISVETFMGGGLEGSIQIKAQCDLHQPVTLSPIGQWCGVHRHWTGNASFPDSDHTKLS